MAIVDMQPSTMSGSSAVLSWTASTGDLVVGWLSIAPGRISTWPVGWTVVSSHVASNMRVEVAVRKAAGGPESEAITFVGGIPAFSPIGHSLAVSDGDTATVSRPAAGNLFPLDGGGPEPLIIAATAQPDTSLSGLIAPGYTIPIDHTIGSVRHIAGYIEGPRANPYAQIDTLATHKAVASYVALMMPAEIGTTGHVARIAAGPFLR